MEFDEMKRNTSNWSNFCILLHRAGLSASAGLSCYPRDAMLAWVIVIATCLSVRPSRAGIVSKRRKLASWFLHLLVAPRL